MAIYEQEITDQHAIYRGDCCEVLKTLPDNSIHMSLYSPPFATDGGKCLYNYSSADADLSNCRSYEEFFEHYEFVVKEIARVTMPGRITAVHCMDTPKDGANICGYNDFPGDIIRLHQKNSFEYLPRICIWKEPLWVRTRTMLRSLRHCQIVQDATLTTVAASDYLIPFRLKGENKSPVIHEQGLMNYAGSRQVPADLLRFRGWSGDQKENRYSHWIWRQYASSVWDDIRGCQGQGEKTSGALTFDKAMKEKDEQHPHPLQLDVICRACVLWSNPGETVLTPFMGIGSEVYGAVLNSRKGIGIELKKSYYNQAKKNLANVRAKEDTQKLW